MRKNFLFVGPSLETRRETVEFPFELLPASRRQDVSLAGEEAEEAETTETRPLVYISMGTLYKMNPKFFKVGEFLNRFRLLLLITSNPTIRRALTPSGTVLSSLLCLLEKET